MSVDDVMGPRRRVTVPRSFVPVAPFRRLFPLPITLSTNSPDQLIPAQPENKYTQKKIPIATSTAKHLGKLQPPTQFISRFYLTPHLSHILSQSHFSAKKKKNTLQREIEPRSPAQQAGILTTILPETETHFLNVAVQT